MKNEEKTLKDQKECIINGLGCEGTVKNLKKDGMCDICYQEISRIERMYDL
jgi:hypothetical protein